MTQVLSLFRGLIDISPSPPTMRQIASAVAERHGVTLEDLRGPQRARRYVLPRHEAFAITISTGRFSYPQVGRFYNRDHTTVMHGQRAHEARQRGERLDRSCGLKARAE